MKFSAAIATLAVMAASALPIHDFHKRELGGILMCTGANATGTCQHQVYEMNTCHQLPAPYYANISTFAPDGEDFSCYPRLMDCDGICRSPTGCTFGAVDFNYEHKYNLSAIQWDTLFKSFDCTAKKWSNSTGASITKRTA
ncbi:hypothetical protein EDB81DRAFT_156951 [Dactylonectria macrodidyma]|uniref:Uncharacterized protein n=1 Tax=Dactylonectria macrodidyma TaxID=307937 RepID=A0A9P9FNL7_9HYPO|nr:hypothetical protein EDB81DRAFT_156951 [Dactylonectria macrodidyma]